ncbi:hypothetical protein SFC65_24250 [Priestia filamentosa]|uniref:hypothetical protein n=1 Tax=Priestia filamentosa TaxID=1402861 RepID=UPI003982977A
MKFLKSKVVPVILTATIASGFVGSVSASAQTTSPSTHKVEVPTTSAQAVSQVDALKSPEVKEEAKLKIAAYTLRAGGWALEKMLAPLSKRQADLIRKWRFKVADALIAVETATEKALTTGMTRVGIPKDVAEDIAKIMVSIIL